MKYSFLIIAFALWFSPDDGYSQEQALPQLTAGMVGENGVLVFSTSEEWKYHPGDDPQWASPEFDDSGWYDLAPGGLGIDAMPDSLWNGYGWWRYTFTADSSFYNENWNLFFNGWGAAEVFMDGQRVHQFGHFSTDPDKERTFSPSVAFLPPIKITEKDTHTIAVRYSHHQAKSYNSIIKVHAGNLGFGFGFGTHALNQFRAQSIFYFSFALFVSAAVLFVLFLLHLMLFYKFPEDRSNLFISVIVGLLLISVVTHFNFIYLDVTRYWSSMLRWIFLISTSFSILFLPYVIAEIFKLEKQKKVLWLIAAIPLIVVPDHLLNQTLGNYITLIIFSIAIFLIGYICWKAYKSGKRGVGYVAFGALGTLIFGIFTTLRIYGQSFQVESVMITFIYTLFPLGMTLYVANGYGYLFTSLEGEIADRTKKLNQSLEDLKATQDQLVQQEKLASLGELTAGIAHEIQNPLNFVNNFSEVSNELIEEMQEEMEKGDLDEAKVIASDIKQNLEKITHHGKRAGDIVKGMLQHSRTSSSQKEPTDINALADEYLRLAYHGLRAKDKSFNADYRTDFDPNLPKIEVIPQDIGRVLLNLINNAFYAVSEKSESFTVEKIHQFSLPKYKPTVTISTKNLGDRIEISVKDNGNGIPEETKNKIFQPFFTTKPTGQGTGLGLSLSYDIVKAHEGDISINTLENESTEFTITLPA